MVRAKDDKRKTTNAGDAQKFVQPPHIGHLIHQEVERQGLTVVSLARMLSCSRTNIYKIFDRQSIDTDQLLRISSLLHTDFFRFYSEFL